MLVVSPNTPAVRSSRYWQRKPRRSLNVKKRRKQRIIVRHSYLEGLLWGKAMRACCCSVDETDYAGEERRISDAGEQYSLNNTSCKQPIVPKETPNLISKVSVTLVSSARLGHLL